MYVQVENKKENKSRVVVNSVAHKKLYSKELFSFVNKQPIAISGNTIQRSHTDEIHAKIPENMTIPKDAKYVGFVNGRHLIYVRSERVYKSFDIQSATYVVVENVRAVRHYAEGSGAHAYKEAKADSGTLVKGSEFRTAKGFVSSGLGISRQGDRPVLGVQDREQALKIKTNVEAGSAQNLRMTYGETSGDATRTPKDGGRTFDEMHLTFPKVLQNDTYDDNDIDLVVGFISRAASKLKLNGFAYVVLLNRDNFRGTICITNAIQSYNEGRTDGPEAKFELTERNSRMDAAAKYKDDGDGIAWSHKTSSGDHTVGVGRADGEHEVTAKINFIRRQ